MAVDPFDAELDQPLFDGESENYIVCSTPRTGSSLLCELLIKASVGVPLEYFHRRDHVPKLLNRYGLLELAASTVTMEDYIAALKRNRTTPNGWFGFKAHRGHYKWLSDHCNLDQCFPGLKYIYVSRTDTLAQAVSVSKAVQTKQWTSGEGRIAEPVYSEAHISYCLHTIQKSNRFWRELFAKRGIDPLHIVYEEVAADKRAVLEKVLAYLGAAGVSTSVWEVDATLKRQFDAVNQEWIDRYRSTHGTGGTEPSE